MWVIGSVEAITLRRCKEPQAASMAPRRFLAGQSARLKAVPLAEPVARHLHLAELLGAMCVSCS